MQEGKENLIDVDAAIANHTISLVLDYLYKMDYDDASGANLQLNVDVYIAADFYDIPVLKELAVQKFKNVLATLWNSPQLFPAIEAIYTNTSSTDSIRKIVMNIVMLHRGVLMNPDTSMLPRLLGEIPELGRDVAMTMFLAIDRVDSRWDGFKKVQCQSDACKHIWADPRDTIPNLACPGCGEMKYKWDNFQVD